MKYTVFTTPVLSTVFRIAFNLFFRLSGWKAQGRLPDLQKYLIIGAPHTSNWDLLVALWMGFHHRRGFNWLGKAELFRGPFGPLFRWLGGIAVDRRNACDVVGQCVTMMKKSSSLLLVISPEGTRSRVRKWKTGFYRIASGAGLPVLFGFIDFSNKVAGFGPLFHPTGDMDLDIAGIKNFYRDKYGIKAVL